MRFGMSNARARDTRVTVTQAVAGGRATYENGRIKKADTDFTTFSFWGDVKDLMDSQGDIRYAEYKRLDSRVIRIKADSRTTSQVNISDTLTLDNSADVFEVIDIFQDHFKYTSTIVAKYKS